jgi:hypothetical protein
MTRLILASSLLLLVGACAASGALSQGPLNVGAEWAVLVPHGSLSGGSRRYVLVEVPAEAIPDNSHGAWNELRFPDGRFALVDVQAQTRGGTWLPLTSVSHGGSNGREFLLFALTGDDVPYRSVRLRCSLPIVVPSVFWSTRSDI